MRNTSNFLLVLWLIRYNFYRIVQPYQIIVKSINPMVMKIKMNIIITIIIIIKIMITIMIIFFWLSKIHNVCRCLSSRLVSLGLSVLWCSLSFRPHSGRERHLQRLTWTINIHKHETILPVVNGHFKNTQKLLHYRLIIFAT